MGFRITRHNASQAQHVERALLVVGKQGRHVIVE
jgi:hypothetical protein